MSKRRRSWAREIAQARRDLARNRTAIIESTQGIPGTPHKGGRISKAPGSIRSKV